MSVVSKEGVLVSSHVLHSFTDYSSLCKSFPDIDALGPGFTDECNEIVYFIYSQKL